MIDKSVLIIDTPKSCTDCLFYNFSKGDWLCNIHNEKIFRCPLKTMPQRRYSLECGDSDGNRWKEPSEYDNGYNDCIDEILGEQNG